MTQRGCENIVDLLRDYIHPDYGEAQDRRQSLPRQAVENATSESCRVFLEIHEALSRLVNRDQIRTRYIGEGTSTGGYGLAYHRGPVVRRARDNEIQAVLLPTKLQYSGMVDVYFSGHASAPIQGAVVVPGRRAGLPVFRVISAPTPQFVRETITAFGNAAHYR